MDLPIFNTVSNTGPGNTNEVYVNTSIQQLLVFKGRPDENLILKATSGNSFDLGTSSILLNYNTSALAFQSYTPIAFDSAGTCVNAWSPQQYDLDALRGEFNLTMKLTNPNSNCITVDDIMPKVVGTICFTILQQGDSPDITFDESNTRLNRNIPDNGTI